LSLILLFEFDLDISSPFGPHWRSPAVTELHFRLNMDFCDKSVVMADIAMTPLRAFHTERLSTIRGHISRQTSYSAADAYLNFLYLGFYGKSSIDFAACISIRAALYIGAVATSHSVVIILCQTAATGLPLSKCIPITQHDPAGTAGHFRFLWWLKI